MPLNVCCQVATVPAASGSVCSFFPEFSYTLSCWNTVTGTCSAAVGYCGSCFAHSHAHKRAILKERTGMLEAWLFFPPAWSVRITDHRCWELVKYVLLSCWFLLEHSVLVPLPLSQACSLPSPFRRCRCRPGPQQLRAHRSARRASTVAFLQQGRPAAVLRHPALQDRHCPHPGLPLFPWSSTCYWANRRRADISFAYLKVRQMGSAVSPEDLGGVMLSTVTHCNPSTLLSSLLCTCDWMHLLQSSSLSLCFFFVIREPLQVLQDKQSLKGLWTALKQYSVAWFYADIFPGNI